jgi:uncharacterized integral membrane protein (TIGR00697 family)
MRDDFYGERLMNEILAVGSLLTYALMIVIACKLGKEFVFVFGTFAIVASNAVVGYEVELFGFPMTWVVLIYCMNFLAINCLTEFYSKRDAIRYVLNMAFMQVLFFVYILTSNWLELSGGENYKQSVEQLYSITPRITLAAVISHILLFMDASIYKFLKDKEGQGWYGQLWFRAAFSAMVSHLIINTLFFTIAFYGSIPNDVLVKIIIANMAIKYVVSLAETPLMYFARFVMRSNFLEKYRSA